MSRRKYDPAAPRYNVIKSAGRGEIVAFGYSEPFVRRRARELAETLGEALVVLDLAKARRVFTAKPSAQAIARRKAQPKPLLTSGGQDSTSLFDFVFARRAGVVVPFEERHRARATDF